MRFGLIIYGSLETITGGFFYERMLVEHLRRSGDEVHVISLPWRGYGRHLGDNLSRALFRQLRNSTFDVLLQDELNHPSLFWLNQRLRKAVGYPIVTIVHLLRCSEPRSAWQNLLFQWVERQYLCSVDGSIWNSRATRASAEELAGRGRPGVVAYPGCDHLTPTVSQREIVERAQQPGPLRVIFVGNLSPVKGLHALLEALVHLPKDDWRLTVVGSLTKDPGYVRNVRQRIARLELNDRIELLGALPNPQVSAYLEQAHVLAVPSFYEGFGIAYLEAMGFGLPVIASAVGAAGEIITHGREGFLVSPGDSVSLSRHLRRLHEDRDLLLRMGLMGLERHATHPTWAASAESIRAFLHGLTRRGQ